MADGDLFRALDLLATFGALWLARMFLLRQPISVQTAGTAF